MKIIKIAFARGRRVALVLWVLIPNSLLAQSPVLSSALPEAERKQHRVAYKEHCAVLEQYRLAKLRNYNEGGRSERAAVLKKVRERIESDLTNHLFPAWYGTTWAFHGTSQVPGEGEIACGYFVSTCLTHLGVKAPRIKLAQQASQKIIATFMDRGSYKISAGKTIAQVRAYLAKTGDGLYLVGLDTHVGFVSVRGEEMVFVHSSYYQPDREVKAEPIDSHNPLRDSNYRVFGKLFSDEMLVKWLKGERFVVP